MPYTSPKHLKNPHLQTILPLFYSIKNPGYIHEDFYFEDGDFTEIVYSEDPKARTFEYVSVLFHGLGGSIHSHYIQRLMQTLSEAGHLCVLMHFRGCGIKTNDSKRSYHAGETGDASFLIQSLKQEHPSAKLYAVGYSLGANMLVKLLSSYKNSSPLEAAVCVSTPLELEACTRHLSKGFAQVYQKYLLKSLKDALLIKAKKYDLESEWGLTSRVIKNIKTIYEFDDIYTAPAHGFKDAKDYYTKNSSKQFLKEIQTPTLMIHAIDDPFVPSSILPKEEQLSSYITLELSENGGHVGFVEGSVFKPNFWLENRIKSFFA